MGILFGKLGPFFSKGLLRWLKNCPAFKRRQLFLQESTLLNLQLPSQQKAKLVFGFGSLLLSPTTLRF